MHLTWKGEFTAGILFDYKIRESSSYLIVVYTTANSVNTGCAPGDGGMNFFSIYEKYKWPPNGGVDLSALVSSGSRWDGRSGRSLPPPTAL